MLPELTDAQALRYNRQIVLRVSTSTVRKSCRRRTC
ncbi:Uncharacterised protein [Serratia fonticola]|uniref:Uncharacterized protein n=1 Tax=Serratia fonticola TaxID=47917 RepID=A0A4U9TLA0_SERFO|nr:Uncharacterised protein [Serratia fonticola]